MIQTWAYAPATSAGGQVVLPAIIASIVGVTVFRLTPGKDVWRGALGMGVGFPLFTFLAGSLATMPADVDIPWTSGGTLMLVPAAFAGAAMGALIVRNSIQPPSRWEAQLFGIAAGVFGGVGVVGSLLEGGSFTQGVSMGGQLVVPGILGGLSFMLARKYVRGPAVLNRILSPAVGAAVFAVLSAILVELDAFELSMLSGPPLPAAVIGFVAGGSAGLLHYLFVDRSLKNIKKEEE
ncbi:MAG: hypothetical protein JJ976_06445 [Rhodothermales bacterium]|nr:hypothetical protein [Rhodothermales bacterium]